MPGPVIPLEGIASPALLPLVQLAMERILKSGGTVLEFGSGHSTVWFAELGCKVVSAEPDVEWYHAVQGWLIERNLKVDLLLVRPDQMASVTRSFSENYFDLVLVDGYSTYRMDCISLSSDKVRPGGWIVLDDSQAKRYRRASYILDGWSRTDIQGNHTRKTGITKWKSTSFYQRPKCS